VERDEQEGVDRLPRRVNRAVKAGLRVAAEELGLAELPAGAAS
jgi:hypothetical protein